jgi:hypothetical protein
MLFCYGLHQAMKYSCDTCFAKHMAETAVQYWQESYNMGGRSATTSLTTGLGLMATTTLAMATTVLSE